MSITRDHNEWLSLVPISGPFLSLPVLAQAFPQGLDAHDADHARRLRMAFVEWDGNQLGNRPDPAIHRAWIKLVLGETLGYDKLLAEGQEIPPTLKSEIVGCGEKMRPDFIVNDPVTRTTRLLIQVYPRSQSLNKPLPRSASNLSPDTRMMQLLRDSGIRLGIVTNGDHWMLVNAPKNETTGYVSWYANLWLEEPVTLRAFRTLLCADRLFNVPEAETLDLKDGLLDRSANDQQEVTDQLGYQVRKAVEVLIQALDKADQDHGGKLLTGVDEKILYESALTVMMRLVFLFCAEERGLIPNPADKELYDRFFAASTLRESLRIAADQYGEEILGLRYDAWTRLLTTFRAVYAGAKHDRLKLRAYGGSLFDPDRFPFLEGRPERRNDRGEKINNWREEEATPLPVNNRTVLHLLEALQVLRSRLTGGGAVETRKLSFRALDIEQIGHVYEGLLDHTAKRATDPVLGLAGTRDKEPEISLAELEKTATKGEKELLKFLKEETGRSESALKKGLNAEIEDQLISRFRTACQDSELWKRVKPFAGLVRLDDVEYPVVINTGSVFVTAGTDRRSSGTHYTPKSLTEPIVQYTLEPLVFVGSAEGLPREEWKLRSAKELLALKICDMACGSGAFLVQACRFMAAQLLEAWKAVQQANPGTLRITPEGEPSTGQPGEMLIPDDPDERKAFALRIVAQRCLYGVDKNHLAVEMAKLSLWLLTLAKDKPFEFLDHAIRCGDSLVGIHNLAQLRKFDLQPNAPGTIDFPGEFDEPVNEAMQLRRQITEMQANTVEDVDAQDRMLRVANEKMDWLKCAADMLIGAEFLRWDQHELIEDELRDEEQAESDDEHWRPSWLKAKKETAQFRRAARTRAWKNVVAQFKDTDLDTFRYECSMWLNGQTPFHWPLEFPEVMVERGGFDAFVGNPPFLGGSRISTLLGNSYTQWILDNYEGCRGLGRIDLCAFFFRRAFALLSPNASLMGLIATNTISQGDTRVASLDYICNIGGTIISARRSFIWPGQANLHASWVCISRSSFKYTKRLDDQCVESINSLLEPNSMSFAPLPLLANKGIAFRGSMVAGEGFVVSHNFANMLYGKNAGYREIVLPYLIGHDLNQQTSQKASRSIIDFKEMSLEDVARYPECLSVVEQSVKPQRFESGSPDTKKRWWQFGRRAIDLYIAISGLTRVIACARTSSTAAFSFVDSAQVFSDALLVFASDKWGMFAMLQSNIHYHWSVQTSSSLKSDLRYSVSDCFETFPLQPSTRAIESIGETYHLHFPSSLYLY